MHQLCFFIIHNHRKTSVRPLNYSWCQIIWQGVFSFWSESLQWAHEFCPYKTIFIMQKANNNTGLSVWPWWSGSELQLVQFPRLGPRGHCNPKGPAIGLVACFIVSFGGFGPFVLWHLSAGKYLSTSSLWMCKAFWRAGGGRGAGNGRFADNLSLPWLLLLWQRSIHSVLCLHRSQFWFWETCDESDDELRVIKRVYGIGVLITRVKVIMIVVNKDGENKKEIIAKNDAQIMLKMMLWVRMKRDY